MEKFKLSILFCFLSLAIFAQINPDLETELKLLIQDVVDGENVAGISVAINTPDDQIWEFASGARNDQEALQVTDHLFGGSTTKSFCAGVLLLLQEEGKIDLDDPIGDYLPAYNNVDPTITVRQLLNHTSGLGDYTQNDDLEDYVFSDPTAVLDPHEIAELFIIPSYFDVGTAYRYSNTNYLLAGLIVERVEQSPFADVLREKIIERQNYESMTFGAYENPVGTFGGLYIDLGQNGTLDDVGISPTTSLLSSAFSAGAIVTRPRELTKWVKYLVEDNSILEEESKNQMFEGSGSNPNYGLGIANGSFDGSFLVGHNGSIIHRTEMIYITELDISFSIMINGGILPDSFLEAFYRLLLEEDFLLNDESLFIPSLQAYPNPFYNEIRIDGINNDAIVELFDPLGNKIAREEFNSSNNHVIENLANYLPGVYYLRILDSGQEKLVPILKH